MKKSICGIYLVFTGLFLYIFNRVPYCHDEWAWGLPSRIDMMKNGFDGYNGRYFGNLLAILITRSIVAKTVLLALCMTGLLLIVEKVIGVDSKKRVFFC